MPASSAIPKAEPGPSSTTSSNTLVSTGMSSAINGCVLRIDSNKPADKLKRVLVNLQGSCSEQPYWHFFAHNYPDQRTRRPLTLPFTSDHRDNLFFDSGRQESIRETIWRSLKDILATKNLAGLPKIVFDEYEHAQTGVRGQAINLTFSSFEAFHCVDKSLKELDIEGPGKQRRRYVAPSHPSALAGNIFIFDCLNVPLESIGVQALLAALREMTQDFGTLLGLAKVVVEGKDEGIESDLDTVRGYLQLAAPWVSVPLRDLATRFPSHFVWLGTPHKLLYVGYDLHTKALHSANFPSETSSAAGPSASEAASKKRKTTTEG